MAEPPAPTRHRMMMIRKSFSGKLCCSQNGFSTRASSCFYRNTSVVPAGQQNAVSDANSLPVAPRQFRGTKELLCFGFEALVVNGARCLILRGDLPRDLFAERHAGHKMWRADWGIIGRGLPRPGRRKGRSNT